jgi:hypothetical protein
MINVDTKQSAAAHVTIEVGVEAMYVVKFDRVGIFWYAKLFQKEWSDEILSHKIKVLDGRKFLIKIIAKKWIRKKIYESLIQQKELEIYDG